MNGNSYDRPYAMTSISAPALVAAYGFVGVNNDSCSVLESFKFSPYTSSVETCKNVLIFVSVARRHASSNACVPSKLFLVNSYEFPNELSTCDCAAKCITTSIFSLFNTYVTRSNDRTSPLTNVTLGNEMICSRFFFDEQ